MLGELRNVDHSKVEIGMPGAGNVYRLPGRRRWAGLDAVCMEPDA